MRLDTQRREEIAKRKGNTGRTLVMTIWFGLGFVAAYYATTWLFAQGIITPRMFYNVGLSEKIPEIAIRGFLMLVLVAAIQTVIFLIYGIFSKAGRRKTGIPTAKALTHDPFQNDYRR